MKRHITLYKEFASSEQVEKMRYKFKTGIFWGGVEQELFEVMDEALRESRKKYQYYMENPVVANILQMGSSRQINELKSFLQKLKIGLGEHCKFKEI